MSKSVFFDCFPTSLRSPATFQASVLPSARTALADERREAVREAQSRAEFLGVYGGNLSALDLLQEISKRVPPDLEVVFEELSIDGQTIRIRVIATWFSSLSSARLSSAAAACWRTRACSIASKLTSGARHSSLAICVLISDASESDQSAPATSAFTCGVRRAAVRAVAGQQGAEREEEGPWGQRERWKGHAGSRESSEIRMSEAIRIGVRFGFGFGVLLRLRRVTRRRMPVLLLALLLLVALLLLLLLFLLCLLHLLLPLPTFVLLHRFAVHLHHGNVT